MAIYRKSKHKKKASQADDMRMKTPELIESRYETFDAQSDRIVSVIKAVPEAYLTEQSQPIREVLKP